MGGLACITAAGGALAQKSELSASAGATATYNHYTGANQQPDGFVACLTAALGIHSVQTARLKINGTVGANEFLCTGGQGNSFAPSVALNANLEAIEKFFFIDATANVAETFVTPFGPQPSNLTVQTNNRYISQTYSVSPYIQGVIAPNISYSLRDDNVWTPSASYGDSSVKTPTTYQNSLNGQMSSVVGHGGGWTLQYSRQEYDNGIDTGTYVIQVVRAIASFAVDPQLTLSVRGGYESDAFPALSGANGALLPSSNNSGSIYGGGLNWRPTERTAVDGFWEHRFFGSSYNLQASHRLPNIALSANFARGLSTFPQVALAIPAGITVAQFLDAAFTTRIPDPAQRAAAVAQFLAQTGLPPTLTSPLNFYSQSITLQQTASLSAVWAGTRNALGFTLFNSRTDEISGTGSELPSAIQFGASNTQTGGGVNYSYRLSGLTNLVASAIYSRTKPNNTEGTLSNVRTDNFNTFVSVNTQFSPKTSGTVGVTYFTFNTPGGSTIGNQSTVSVYASVSHTF
ncbi:MAG TPA: TIGR03016 family PEP-CTERM system-associated outer membrane protein [Casimicrobiaceae bacterium]|nr:TIGR03016 family PEP-CTERM system-associated outer membrane protein [Casimicrobiaceae bacterium]